MVTKRKNLLITCVALILTFVLVICCVFNRKQEIKISLRTVELSTTEMDFQSYEKYLDSFKNYDIESKEDCSVKFNGVMAYNQDFADKFDNISLIDVTDEDDFDIIYDCEFLSETMQFVFSATLIDKFGNIIEKDTSLSDAFVNELGRLDAYIEIDNEKILLSEYENRELLDNCLFGWLKKLAVVVVVVIVYVVVAETAEQIKAKSNYKYNKNLESTGKGVQKGVYITNQDYCQKHIKDGTYDPSIYPEKYFPGDYKFGFTSFDDVGCEVASVYNLLISLGKTEMLSETIYNFEKWCIMYAIGWGKLGSNPKQIGTYLNKRNIKYSKYTDYTKFKQALNKKGDCEIIMSTWNNGGMLKSIFSGEGLHTYYFNKLDDELNTFNLYYDNKSIPFYDIDKIYEECGNFIVAYIVG